MGDFSVRINEKRKTTEIDVAGKMTTEHVKELKAGILSAFRRKEKIQVSLNGVTTADSAGVQLMCSAHRMSVLLDFEFSVIYRDSEVVVSAVRSAAGICGGRCDGRMQATCIWNNR